MQLSNLEIHDECKWNGVDYYHVRLKLPQNVSAVIADAIKNCEDCYFGGLAKIGSLRMEVGDADFENGELQFAYGTIEGINISLSPMGDGLFMDMSIFKEREGEDSLDGTVTIHGLPELFWIHPAYVIRSLIGAAQ